MASGEEDGLEEIRGGGAERGEDGCSEEVGSDEEAPAPPMTFRLIPPALTFHCNDPHLYVTEYKVEAGHSSGVIVLRGNFLTMTYGQHVQLAQKVDQLRGGSPLDRLKLRIVAIERGSRIVNMHKEQDKLSI